MTFITGNANREPGDASKVALIRFVKITKVGK